MHTRFRYKVALDAAGGTTPQATGYINWPRLMSSINRKAFHNIDKRGIAQLYHVNVKLGAQNAEAKFLGAPNTYYVKNAVKEWHKARVAMYRRAGIKMKDLGYGRSFRPYLDVTHESNSGSGSDTEVSSSTGTAPPGTITPRSYADSWTYTRAAVATPAENTLTGTALNYHDLVDTYSFTLLGASVPEDPSSGTTDDPDESTVVTDQDSFVSVGMVDSWLSSFKKKDISTTDTDINPDNPLLQLRSQQGSDKEEVLELASSNQREGRPWDLDSAQYKELQELGFVKSLTGESSVDLLSLPCGLMKFQVDNLHSSSETIDIQFDVVGISDM